MGRLGYVVIGWMTAAMVIGVGWYVWRLIARLIEWSTYWHEQWLELGKIHASDLDKWAQSVEEVEKWKGESRRLNVELARVCNELDRYRKGVNAPVLHVWKGFGEGMVSSGRHACGHTSTVQPMSGVPEAGGQCAPGEAAGGGGEFRFADHVEDLMGSSARALRGVPPTANESVSRGPQGRGGEGGAARGGEPSADAPGVQSSEGSTVSERRILGEIGDLLS